MTQADCEYEKPATSNEVMDNLYSLMDILPSHLQESLTQSGGLENLLEVVLDLGRPPEARFSHGDFQLDFREVTQEDIQHVLALVGEFSGDNRAGIERTLHRISAMRNRKGKAVGITCRVGRAVFGTTKVIEDLVNSDKSILLLGRPGVGKTTMLREVARVLADDAHKRVVIVDTSNEIAGDGDIPHPAIGKARRMQVSRPELQHAVMIEAVENHMPEVIIIDEMGTELDAAAARTIAERGVQLIATAHGNSLQNLVMNPTLSDLVGGIQSVILSDEEARRRKTQKAILERKAPPTFDVVVQIENWEKVAVHSNVARVVDKMLRGELVASEKRWVNGDGEVEKSVGDPEKPSVSQKQPSIREGSGPILQERLRLFPFGVNKSRVQDVIRTSGLSVELVSYLEGADILVTTKSHYKRYPQVLKNAEDAGRPVYVLRKNSQPQIQQFFRSLAPRRKGGKGVYSVSQVEAEEAVEQILAGAEFVELSPQGAYVRRLQHLLAQQYNLRSVSVGAGAKRRVTIYRSEFEV
ncbi:MAG: single-stranded DNA-binding protein [SAR202 cluster bacterium Io17-Chloro-G3]|nr:MAG: single-stranded DNA-binding protein [SAR202 cluster bacterium Io17-Chloro-G3]